MSSIQPDWNDKEVEIVDKNDFLNGLKYEDVSDTQKMLYRLYKDIEKINVRLLAIENVLGLKKL